MTKSHLLILTDFRFLQMQYSEKKTILKFESLCFTLRRTEVFSLYNHTILQVYSCLEGCTDGNIAQATFWPIDNPTLDVNGLSCLGSLD